MIEDTMFDNDCYAVFMEEEHEKEKRVRDNISRQAAVRWVKTECNPYGKPTLDFESGKKVIEHLEQMPSAEPEIIRCKECEHWDTSWQNDYAPNYYYCPLVDGTRRDDFYCADAEMRGEA